MQATDRAAKATVAGAPVPAAADLVGALTSLYRAFQKVSLYPSGHPTIPATIADAVRGFESALTGEDKLSLGVARDHFISEHEDLAESGGTLGSMAALLHELDVAGLSVERGLSEPELHGFVLVLDRARKNDSKGPALSKALRTEGIEHVEVRPIDYGMLTFSEGSKKPDTEDHGPEDIWEILGKVASGRNESGGNVAPAQLAAKAVMELGRHEGAGLGVLRQGLKDMVRKLRTLSPEQRSRLRGRLGGFVSALDPSIRANLLRLDVSASEDSLSLLAELVDDLPVQDVVETLLEADLEEIEASEELLNLLNKLVDQAKGQPLGRSPVHQTLAKWGVSSEVLSGGGADLRSVLQEVFHRRSQADFNPGDYQSLLERLSRHSIRADKENILARYRDPRDANDVRLQGVQLGLQLLRRADGDRHKAGLFAHLGTHTDFLLERDHLEVLRDAAMAAWTHAEMEYASATTRDSARGYLRDFESPERVRSILAKVSAEGTVSEAASALLGLGGSHALEGAIELMERGCPDAVRRSLLEFVRGRDATDIEEVLDTRWSRGWSGLESLFPVVRGLEPERRDALLRKLVRHEDFRVRREALQLTAEGENGTGFRQKVLRRALSDPNGTVTITAIRLLGEVDLPGGPDLLVGFLEGRLGRALPTNEMARHAVRALLCKGDLGIDLLCGCLLRLSRSPRPAKMRVARVVAEELQPRQEEDRVRRCLKSCRLSLFGLLFLSRGATARDGG